MFFQSLIFVHHKSWHHASNTSLHVVFFVFSMCFHVSQQRRQSTKDIKDEVPWNLGSEHVHKTGSLEMEMDSYASMDKRYKQIDNIRTLPETKAPENG